MAKQEAMSLEARRAGPFVATGIALATAGILVAVPAIAPPLTAREAQVAADVQSALSTAEVNLAALSDALSAAITAFQSGGPVGSFLAALDTVVANPAASAAIATFQSGGPVGAVLAAINALITAPAGGATTLAAQGEASTPITNVGGLFGRNAATNAGRSFVNLFTPSQADEGNQSDSTIEANAEAPKPLRAALRERPQAALPKPFQRVVPKAPITEVPEAPVTEVNNKAPVIKVPEKTDEGTKGSGEGNGLVRNSLQFKPNTILPVGSESGAGAGGKWKPFQRIKDAIGRLTGGGGS